MDRSNELELENAALRERLSRLSEASRRINESLDFEAVLQGVLDSARVLTSSRYGGITTVDGSGEIQDFMTSGFTEEEHHVLVELPEGPQLFEHFNSIGEPVRHDDLRRYTESVGISTHLTQVHAFLMVPIRHQGEHIGNFYLSNKVGGSAFSKEDEDTLVMFASQAALVIANARRYRDERRARSDLETLVNTAPVGVVVFDVATGVPASINREARRIISHLHDPDLRAEDMLNVVTVRRADGREIHLDRFPLARALAAAETVWGEEIVFRVPDGRSVSALMNATPIFREDGSVESFVVTLQDTTPLEELDRVRTEFLGMVGHELRTPLTSIKGSATTLVESGSSLSPAEMLQFHRIINEQADYMRGLIGDLIDVVQIETGTLTVSPAPAEISRLVDDARNTYLTAGGRNSVRIDITPDLPLVMADRLRIVQVINNLLTNASRNSHEDSAIRVNVFREGIHLAVSVADEGRGVPAERLPGLFEKFARIDGQERGRDLGLGLAICKGIVEAHGGRIWAESDGVGLGSRFTFTIPVADDAAVSSAGPAQTAASSRRRRYSDRTRVLVVDDDPWTLKHVRDVLSGAGYEAIVTGNPEEVTLLLEENDPHVVLLDLMLPGTDGIELMRQVIDSHGVPVIFLSAYANHDVISRAFETGAADYVVKPFSPTELVARIKATLRRQTQQPESFVMGDLSIDYSRRTVTVAGRVVELTAIEYRLLVELSANAGAVMTYEQLMQRVWGRGRSSGDLRPMRTVVKDLRRKLGDDATRPRYVFTIPRVGYRLGMADGSSG